jgi:hypothetical protein
MPDILAEWTLPMVGKIRMNYEDFVKSSCAKYPCLFRLKATCGRKQQRRIANPPRASKNPIGWMKIDIA